MSMHWVIQEGMYSEQGFKALLEALERLNIKHSLTKCVPFVGTLLPEPVIVPGERVIIMGTVTMANTARARGWTPGSFLNENFDFEVQQKHWATAMLNVDARVHRFADVPFFKNPVFMRPTLDSKSFSGKVLDWGEFVEWRKQVLALTPEDGATITENTKVMVSCRQEIFREWRLWMVDGRCVTASGYKTGTRVHYDPLVDQDVIDFAETLAQNWEPARAYCMDLCLTEGGYHVVEVNNLNSAGFYAADMNKLVQALEEMAP